MNVKNIFKILQVHVITGRYGKRLGKTDETASTSIVKLNAKSLVASDIRMWKSMNFKWNQLPCFLFLSLFLILWQQSTMWDGVGRVNRMQARRLRIAGCHWEKELKVPERAAQEMAERSPVA